MKKLWMVCVTTACLMVPSCLTAQTAKNGQLNQVLSEMNGAATRFHSATADFVRDTYTAVVQTHEKKRGTIAFRKAGSSAEMMLHVTSADGQGANQDVLYKDGVLNYYEPNLKQETIMPAGKNRELTETFLTLGFGASGKELAKEWQVTFEGWETMDGVKVAKLDLVSKSQQVRDNFSHILVWIDPQKSIAYQQEFFTSSGDTNTVTYSHVRYNVRLPDSIFRIKIAPGTRRIVK
jgi:outer membrane lipoprotein-sorting protein